MRFVVDGWDAKLFAPKLSPKINVKMCLPACIPTSRIKFVIKIDALEPSHKAMYSASLGEKASNECIMEPHKMVFPYRKTTKPVIDLEDDGKQLKELSVNAINGWAEVSLENMIPLSMDPTKYLTQCLAYASWRF